jgi:hypothetical protein
MRRDADLAGVRAHGRRTRFRACLTYAPRERARLGTANGLDHLAGGDGCAVMPTWRGFGRTAGGRGFALV